MFQFISGNEVSEAQLAPPRMAELSEHLGYRLHRAAAMICREVGETLAPLALSPAAFTLLVLLDANPALPASGLARTLELPVGECRELLRALSARGVLRERNQASASAPQLTRKGRAMLQRARMRVAAYESRLAAAVGLEARQALLSLLNMLARQSKHGYPVALEPNPQEACSRPTLVSSVADSARDRGL